MKQKTTLIGVLLLLIVVLVALVVTQLRGRSESVGSAGVVPTPVVPGGNTAGDNSTATVIEQTTAPVNSPSPAIGAVNVASTMTVSVSSPVNGATVSTSPVTVKGKTQPKAEVYVNDVSTVADAAGSFMVQLPLDEGENPIIVVANDADGNMAETELTITYDSGK